MYKYRRVFISIIAGVLVFSLLAGIVVMLVNAKTSDEIAAEIAELERQSDEIGEHLEQLDAEIQENQSRTLTIVEQKAQVDQEIDLIRQSVENVKAQINQYSCLIAQKQVELDALEQEQAELLEKYQLRLRVLQERGEPTIWEVLFTSNSFTEYLTHKMMMEEVASADNRMRQQLMENAQAIISERESLAEEKACLEQKRQELTASEAAMQEKQDESDALLTELLADMHRLIEETIKYEEAEAQLSQQIAAAEVERTQALRDEWAAAHPIDNSGSDDDDSDDDSGYIEPPSTGEYFKFPLPSNVYIVLTSPFGNRTHPITGKYTMHNGVDLACAKGTPIYASKSGYVTIADYHYAWGYYVTINHMDGYSTLYGHMTHYIVSEGDYVNRGDVIGYVGTTGYSTGNHLHFTIYYNGTAVNPMDYISLP